MKILCAPDSFKESLNGLRAALAMAEGVLRAQTDAEIEVCRMLQPTTEYNVYETRWSLNASPR